MFCLPRALTVPLNKGRGCIGRGGRGGTEHSDGNYHLKNEWIVLVPLLRSVFPHFKVSRVDDKFFDPPI